MTAGLGDGVGFRKVMRSLKLTSRSRYPIYRAEHSLQAQRRICIRLISPNLMPSALLCVHATGLFNYMGEKKGLHVLRSRSHAGPGRNFSQPRTNLISRLCTCRIFPLEGMSRCAPPVAAGPSTFNLTHRDRYLGTVVAYLEKEI